MALARMNKHFTTNEVFILGEGQDIVLLLAAAAKWRLRGLHRDDPALKLRLRPSITLLQRLLRDDRAQAGLRRAWHDLGLPGSGVPLSAGGLCQRVVEAVEAGRILAIYFPRPAHVMSGTTDEAALKVRIAGVEGPIPAGTVAGGDVSTWSKTRKVEDMLQRVRRGAAQNLGPKLARELESLLTPQALAIMAASFAILAALHAVGVGEVVDAGLTFYAWWTAGTAGLAALADMLTAIVHAINARSDKDLDDAAQLFTGAVAVLGVSILTLVVTRGGRKPAAGKVAEAGAEDVGAESSVQRGITRDTAREDAKQAAAKEEFDSGDATLPQSEEAAGTTGKTEDPDQFLYRGVHADHPALEAAKQGIVTPGDVNGTISAESHNLGGVSSESPFTSWTRDPELARSFANGKGPGGVILRLPVGAPPPGAAWSWEWSPDAFGENELLLRGMRTGAEVLPP